MDRRQVQPFQKSYDSSWKVDFEGVQITSDESLGLKARRAGGLRNHGGDGREVRPPSIGQRQSGTEHWKITEAARRRVQSSTRGAPCPLI